MLKFIQFISLPVNCDDWLIIGIPNSGHLKGEDGIFEFIIRFPDLVVTCAVEKGFIWKLAMETSHYYYFIIVHLTNSLSLSGLQQSDVLHIKEFPFLSWWLFETRNIEVEFFNCIQVSLGFIRNTAENIDIFLVEWTTTVVVSSLVHWG
jgi:hypothetical protein